MRRKTAYLGFILLVLLTLVGGSALRYFLSTLPAVQDLEDYLPHLTTKLYDCKGRLISEFFVERRTWVPLNQIPVDLQNGFIATEDADFFKHWGVSPKGMIRAAVRNFLAGRVVQGGSTITQQLSKIIFLTQERTLSRKIREFLLAIQIEHRFSKEEILQMYLNQVYFGHGAYGVSAAAHTFFGKDIQDLTLPECALLAGLPRAPTYYSPFNHPDRALNRRATVLMRLRELHYITPQEEQLADKSPLGVRRVPPANPVAPYFAEALRQELEAKYGSEQLYRGGLSIYTTLDLDMQLAAEKVMNDALDQFDKQYGKQAEIIRAKEKTAALRKAKGSNKYSVAVSTTITKVQGALVAIDPQTGGIRAMVGGRNFAESQFNRATMAKRQPGSVFKPFVWLAALDRGFTAASMVNDSPIAFEYDNHDWKLIADATDTYSIQVATSALPPEKVWVPKNYDNKYFGPTTLRRGLAFSRNIISVRLIDQVNPLTVVDWAHKMGIESPLDAVLSLALGTSNVDLLELTSAIGTFAAEGIRTEPYSIVKITDFNGRVLEQNFPKQTEAVSPQLAYLMTNLMRGVILQGTGRAARSLGRPAAGKTGTTQDQRDLWFVGFTPDLVCGAWMGYDDFSPLGRRMAAGGVLVPWWARFMKEALKDTPARDFTVPAGITYCKIDAITGYLALPTCPDVILEAFKAGTEPREYCPVDHTQTPLAAPETEE